MANSNAATRVSEGDRFDEVVNTSLRLSAQRRDRSQADTVFNNT